MKRGLFIFSAVFIVVVVFAAFFRNSIRVFVLEWEKSRLPEETRIPLKSAIPESPVINDNLPKTGQVNLAVPFEPQAPYADWSLPYQEACEETSAILVHYFYQNKNLTPEIADREILNLVNWQKKRFGYYFHTTAKDTATMLKEYYGYRRVDVLNNVTIDDIKEHILAGRPVIAPFAGRMLGNPYYNQPGPVYHMLVIKGVTKDGDFITNDVGTRRGQNYVYGAEVLYNALHDPPSSGDGWNVPNQDEYVRTGKKTIVVVYPNTY